MALNGDGDSCPPAWLKIEDSGPGTYQGRLLGPCESVINGKLMVFSPLEIDIEAFEKATAKSARDYPSLGPGPFDVPSIWDGNGKLVWIKDDGMAPDIRGAFTDLPIIEEALLLKKKEMEMATKKTKENGTVDKAIERAVRTPDPEVGVHRIELDDGQWWEVQAFVEWGLRESIDMAQFDGIDLRGKLDSATDLGDSNALQQALMGDMSNLMKVQRNSDRAMLENGTVAWSFELPIGMGSIRRIKEIYVKPVLDWMKINYAAPTEADSKN